MLLVARRETSEMPGARTYGEYLRVVITAKDTTPTRRKLSLPRLPRILLGEEGKQSKEVGSEVIR